MTKIPVLTILLGCLITSTALGKVAPTPLHQRYQLEPMQDVHLTLPEQDLNRLLADDIERSKNGQAIQYAVPTAVENIGFVDGKASGGSLHQLDDGNWLWRVRVDAAGASTLDFGFTDFWLPRGAELYIRDVDNNLVRGPITDLDNTADGQYASGLVAGESAYIELLVPDNLKRHVSLKLDRASYGYRFLNPRIGSQKSLSCNVDVACPEAELYTNQVNSVAWILVSGAFLCSGSVVNNTEGDGTQYFLTANHCGINASNASSVVFYFNYQSDTCRTFGSINNGSPLNINSFSDALSGATFLAANPNNDFALIQINQTIPESFNVYYAGWDRSTTPPTSAYSIHHPSGHEKRITLEHDPVEIGQLTQLGGFLTPGTYWSVREWDRGVTEGGSSGGPLFNQNNLIVGQLAGGPAFFCPTADEGDDWYGRFDMSWDFGTSADTRLRDWLDPSGSNVQTMQGQGGCDAPSIEITSSSNNPDAGDTVSLTANASGGSGNYSYAWDLDGDSLVDADTAIVNARYPEMSSVTVTLEVTDGTNCSSVTQFGIAVNGSGVETVASGGQVMTPSAPTELCGDGDGNVEPNETWNFPLTIVNNGSAPISNAYAAFAINGSSPTNNSPSSSNSEFTALESGAIFIDNLAVDDEMEISLTAHIGSNFSCGGNLGFDHLGTAFQNGFDTTSDDAFLIVPVGFDGCDSQNTSCPLATFAPLEFTPTEGFYFNPTRSGNGEDLHFINGQLYSAWYTADEQHLPIWYYQQSLTGQTYRYNQVEADLLQFLLSGDITQNTPRFEVVGDVRFAFVNEFTAVKTWTLNGDRSGELITFFNLDNDVVDTDVTDQYFNPNESGWGVGYQRQGENDFTAFYFYDNNGQPTWMTSADSASLQQTGQTDTLQFRVHCPGCVWLPASFSSAGPVDFDPADGFEFDFTSMIGIGGIIPVDWQRNALPLQQVNPN